IEQLLDETLADSHADRARAQAAQIVQLGFQLRMVQQVLPVIAMQDHSRFRRLHAAAMPLEQRHSQASLDAGNGAADSRWIDKERFRGIADALALDDAVDKFQLTLIHQRSS